VAQLASSSASTSSQIPGATVPAGVAVAQTAHQKPSTGSGGVGGGQRLTKKERKQRPANPSKTGTSTGASSLFDRHFASSAAVRDFNEAMPVVIPSSFKPTKGTVVISRPEDRLAQTDD
jgi:hypothetical protein